MVDMAKTYQDVASDAVDWEKQHRRVLLDEALGCVEDAHRALEELLDDDVAADVRMLLFGADNELARVLAVLDSVDKKGNL